MQAADGLAGWVSRALRGRGWLRPERTVRQMEIVETLVLGPKKQLVLIRCGGERFLVGTGGEGVQTIVRVDGSALGGLG